MIFRAKQDFKRTSSAPSIKEGDFFLGSSSGSVYAGVRIELTPDRITPLRRTRRGTSYVVEPIPKDRLQALFDIFYLRVGGVRIAL